MIWCGRVPAPRPKDRRGRWRIRRRGRRRAISWYPVPSECSGYVCKYLSCRYKWAECQVIITKDNWKPKMLRNLHKRKLFILLVKGGGGPSADLRQEFAQAAKYTRFQDICNYEIFRACSWCRIVHAKIGLNPIWRHGHPHRRRRRQPVEARQRVRQNH